jgi:HEAT repeat protein
MLEQQPDNIEVLTALEEVYRRQRRLADAVTLLKRLARLQPARAKEYFQRIANLQLQLYNDGEALRYAHKALALGAHDARSHQRLGELYEKKEDFDAAVEAYRKAIRLAPNSHSARFALGRLHTRRGDYERAERLYREVIRTARAPEVIRKAFRAGVDLSSYLGRLELLEKEIQPRAITLGTNAALYRELLVEVYQRRVPQLLHRARHGRQAKRAAAQAALRQIGRRGLAPLLEQLATSHRPSTARQQLVRLLGYLGNPNAVLPLLRLAESTPRQVPVTIYGHRARAYNHPYSYARVAAAVNERVEATVAVGRLRDERSIPGLVRLLRSSEGAIREAAAWALGRLRQRKASNALFAALGDRRTAVQTLACAGLGLQGEPRLRPALEEVALDPARDEHVRAACAWALGALGDPSSVEPLARAVRSGDDELQRCAAWSLGAIADNRATGALIRSLWTKRPRVRQSVVWALVRIGTGRPLGVQQAPDALIDQGRFAHQQWVARLTAGIEDDAQALARDLSTLVIRHAGAIGDGIDLALGRHRDVVLRVLHDLDGAPGRLTLGPLTPTSPPPGTAGREELHRTITAIGRRILPAIRSLLGHPDELVAQRALSIYAKLAPGEEAGARIEEALSDPRWRIRVAALRAVERCHERGAIDGPRAVALIGNTWKSGQWREREAALSALGGLRHARAATAARRALAGDPNAFVREAAARALGEQRAPAALAALLAALRDDVPHVRAAACHGLARLGTRASIPRLRQLLRDPAEIVRAAARRALRALAR